MKIKIFILFLAISISGFSQGDDILFNGYVKYLPSMVKYPQMSFTIPGYPDLDGQTLNDHLIHFRLNSKWFINEQFTGAMEFRVRGLYGDSPNKIPDYKDTYFTSDYEYSNLEIFLWDQPKSIGHAQIDRLWLDYYKGNFQATLGRQRVAWGTSLVWNITDLFNPMDILDFDYEERPGNDAMRIQYYTGPVSRYEIVYKPGKSKRQTTIAGAWAYNLYDFDTFFLAGIKNSLWTVGGNWAGDIEGAGFRGEFLLTEALSHKTPPDDLIFWPFPDSFFDDKGPNFSMVLSADYTFANSFYIHSEGMYNSNGRTENAGIMAFQAMSAGMLSPARWSLFQEFSYDVTPLIRGSLYGIINPDDKSHIIIPSVSWSVITNLDLMGIIYISKGEELTEFGSYGTAGYLRFKYSF